MLDALIFICLAEVWGWLLQRIAERRGVSGDCTTTLSQPVDQTIIRQPFA
jgi:hypothetical protein